MGIDATIHETMDMDDMKLDCRMGVISPLSLMRCDACAVNCDNVRYNRYIASFIGHHQATTLGIVSILQLS